MRLFVQMIFLSLMLSSPLAFAQTCPRQSVGGVECVANPSSVEITAFTDCHKITNAHASGLGVMVPINSNTEFTTFLSHLPQGVTATSCTPVPVNGQCGPANGSSTPTAPTSGFCSVGPMAGFSGSGPWAWQCLGSNGGSTASCSANAGGHWAARYNDCMAYDLNYSRAPRYTLDIAGQPCSPIGSYASRIYTSRMPCPPLPGPVVIGYHCE